MRVLKWLLRSEKYWLAPYELWGFRRGFAESLRWIADRIGPEDAFTKHSGLRFANQVGVGQVLYIRPDEKATIDKFGSADQGVELWYRVSAYKERGWEER